MDAILNDENMDNGLSILDLATVPIEDIIEENQAKKKEKLYSLWMDYGKDYVPAVNLQTCEKLPSGIYKVKEDRDGIHFRPTTVETDELYNFSDSFTDVIMKEVKDFWNKKDLYKQFNIVHKRGLLLEGSPGCGKTAAIALLVNDLLANDGIVFLINNLKDFDNLYDNLSGVVRKIEPERPVITIIEDVDKLVDAMGTDAPLLDLLDGKVSIDHHLVIMTSNDTSSLSTALLRPSRIDMRFVVEPPTEQTRREFFEKKKVNTELIDKLVEVTDGMSFAQLKEVFIGVTILGKDPETVAAQVLDPNASKDYLNKAKTIGL